MSIQSSPQAGSFVNMAEKTTGSNSAGSVSQNVLVGTPNTGTQFAAGSGTATSVNVLFSQTYNLAGAAQTIDLTAAVDAIGTKAFAKVRGIRVQNNAAVDSGYVLDVYPGASNGFVNFLSGTTPKVIVPANSEFYLSCVNTAGWAVSSTNKTLTLDPGANTVPCTIVVFGE